MAAAEAVMSGIEQEIIRTHQEPLPQPEAAPTFDSKGQGGSAWNNLSNLVAPPLTRISLMTWALWLSITFSYYSFFTWIPTLLVQSGMTITRSFAYSISIYAAMIPGYYSAAYFNDRVGRRATIVSYLVLGGVAAVGLAKAASNLQIIFAGVCLSFFMNGVYAGVYAYTSEIFPTRIRTTGVGLASAVGRLGAISAPILVGAIFPRFGFAGVFGVTTLVLLAGAMVVVIFGVRTDGRSLEAIAAGELADRAPFVQRRGVV